MDNVEVVHVPPVVFGVKRLLYPVVKLVQVHEREKLARLIAQRQALGAVDVGTHQFKYLVVHYPPTQFLLQDVVVDAGEKVVNVRFQNPPARIVPFFPWSVRQTGGASCGLVPALALPVVFLHLLPQAVQADVHPLPHLRRKAILDKAVRDCVVQDVIDKGVLYHLVHKRGCLH